MSEATDLVRSRRLGWSLEQPFYVDPLYFQLDLDHVFRTGWLFAGHTCQIKEPGDYFCYDIADDSLIIIRGNDRKVRALFNVCRHRGSLICKVPKGHVKRLVCPYHQWTYDTDGSLLRNTWMPVDFVNDDFNLKQAYVKTVAGLIYVSLADVAPAFAPEEDLKSLLEPHGLESAKVAYSETYDIAVNWNSSLRISGSVTTVPPNTKVTPKFSLTRTSITVTNRVRSRLGGTRVEKSGSQWASTYHWRTTVMQ